MSFGVRQLAAALGWAGYGENRADFIAAPLPPQSGGKPPHSKAGASSRTP